MELQSLLGLLAFAAIAAYTPGPNNTLLMSAGMNFGFRRTIPMILGVTIGFPIMIVLVGLGVGKVFEWLPQFYTILKFAGALYLIWLAWKIATSAPTALSVDPKAKPAGFVSMCLFQWVNPKGWMMALTALSTYSFPERFYLSLGLIVGTFIVMGVSSATAWAVFGTALRKLMTDPKRAKVINWSLAILLVASLIPVFWQ
jgi:threonine/homoserine/homoserine lactone efflux protein